MNIAGVNYEGGKIAEHFLSGEHCKGYTNLQISMDAPFHDREAPEEVRRAAPGGRVETTIEGYDEPYLIESIASAILRLSEADLPLKIQIARGNSAEAMKREVVDPILKKLGVRVLAITRGYRSTDYCVLPDTPFIGVNIGMFAQLFDGEPGRVFVQSRSLDVEYGQRRKLEVAGRSQS